MEDDDEDEDDSEMTEGEVVDMKDSPPKQSNLSKDNLFNNVLDHDKPQVWGENDTEDEYKSDEFIEPSDQEPSEDKYQEKLKSDRKFMDKSESFIEESKSDISKLHKGDISSDQHPLKKSKITDRSEQSVKKSVNKSSDKKLDEKQPSARKLPAKRAVPEHDDAMDLLDDDDEIFESIDDEEYLKNMPNLDNNQVKQVSSEWDPRKERK